MTKRKTKQKKAKRRKARKDWRTPSALFMIVVGPILFLGAIADGSLVAFWVMMAGAALFLIGVRILFPDALGSSDAEAPRTKAEDRHGKGHPTAPAVIVDSDFDSPEELLDWFERWLFFLCVACSSVFVLLHVIGYIQFDLKWIFSPMYVWAPVGVIAVFLKGVRSKK